MSLKLFSIAKTPYYFAKTKVTYKTGSFCNFLRCGYKRRIYIILLHSSVFLMNVTQLLLKSLNSNRDLPAQHNQLDSGL